MSADALKNAGENWSSSFSEVLHQELQGFRSGTEVKEAGQKEIETLWDSLTKARQEAAAAAKKSATDDARATAAENLEQAAQAFRAAIIAEAHGERLAGLAFSGGGIRSATFNLGVLQTLADLGLLGRFNYLSTVSGGGYIGSWLRAWIYWQPDGLQTVGPALKTSLAKGAASASGRSAPARPSGAAGAEEIHFLRRFSNYLTPKLGWLGADTWTVIAIYLRNVLLNMTALGAALAAAVMWPRVIGWLLQLLPGEGWGFSVLFAAVVVALLVAGIFTSLNLRYFRGGPSAETPASAPGYARQSGVQFWIVFPIFLAAVLSVKVLPLAPPPWSLGEPFTSWWSSSQAKWWLPWVPAVVMILAYLFRADKTKFWRGLDVVCSFLIGGEIGWFVLAQLHRWLPVTDTQTYFWPRLIWLPPGFLVAFLLGVVAYLGLRGRYFDRKDRDQSAAVREWWSRLGAWLLICALFWIGFLGVAFYSPPLVYWLALNLKSALAGLGFVWVFTTISSLFAAKNPASGRGNPNRWTAALISAGPYVFVVGVFVILACLIDFGLAPLAARSAAKGPPRPTHVALTVNGPGVQQSLDVRVAATLPPSLEAELRQHWDDLNRAHLGTAGAGAATNERMGWGLLGAFLVVALLSARIDLNEFSMHTMYRDRLARCYLGAAHRAQRRPHPFTGFDPNDDIDLAELWQRKNQTPLPAGAGKSWDHLKDGPYPIINCSLNLVGGDELAWQERKAASFVFTPRFCGYDFDDMPPGFCPTGADQGEQSYAGSKRPVTLATAMAISGAAVSPNMGYHSSPAAAFLMTLFNVRLGWWIGNPRNQKGWLRSSPSWAFGHLIAEMFGLTNAGGRYIYLSDGGHFENLGLFELVRRRCRFIIVCDAEEDHDFKFEGLGNAIEKCRTDLGVNIELKVEAIRQRDEHGHSRWHCAVGRIRYDETDPEAHAGTILYLKSSLTGDEPTDVLRYAARHDAFPHESTSDQWFGESQFESYRALGQHAARQTFLRVAEPNEFEKMSTERLFTELGQRWYPPSRALDPAFERRGETLNTLYESLRTDPQLRFLHQQIYSEWRVLVEQKGKEPPPPAAPPDPWLPPTYDELRAGFYFCNRLILLMEDVYHDLHLEEEHAHPDNRGWMNLFMHWVWSRMFRTTWTISAANCGARFQNFCGRHLGIHVGRLELFTANLTELLAQKEQAQDSPLTFVEWQMLRAFCASLDESIKKKTQLRLIQILPAKEKEVATQEGPVEGDRTTTRAANDEPAFTVGFALLHLTEPRELMYLRIRDHMRRMGLARRGLDKLLEEEETILALRPMPDTALQGDDADSCVLLQDLFRGVEVDQELEVKMGKKKSVR